MEHIRKELVRKLNKLETIIDYQFRDKDKLILALTHSSYANEHKGCDFTNNERMEFLGDAILNIIISEKLYLDDKNLNEGAMTKARSLIVCEATLVKCANKIGLPDFLLLGKGEELTGGRFRASIVSDALEAVIGAIYLDSGMEEVKRFIFDNMGEMIAQAIKGQDFLDFKTQFQEFIQQKGENRIRYEILEEKGPDHDKTFVSQVEVEGKAMGTGKGKSKKEAEQNAAKEALINLGVI